MSRYNDNWYPPYVSAAEKKARNAKLAAKLAGKNLKPVVVEGRKIAKTFWGKAWCDNVESYRDYENRLPRGRSYVRQGAVLDLQISAGLVTALVAGSGSRPYAIKIEIAPISESRREALKKQCAGKVSSLLALAQGKLPPELLAEFCDRRNGLFPSPAEIKTNCSCPDWAGLCKHLAAVFYGIGARLDEEPALFFTLRGIDQDELVGAGAVESLTEGVASELAAENLADVFGVEFDTLEEAPLVKAAPVVEWTPERVRELRQRLGFNQTEFGKHCGTHAMNVSLWERGKSPVAERFREKLEELSTREPKARLLPVTPLEPSGGRRKLLEEASTRAQRRLEEINADIRSDSKEQKWTAENIRALRKRLGCTQAEFGRLCGVTVATVGFWERGTFRASDCFRDRLRELSRSGKPVESAPPESLADLRKRLGFSRAELGRRLGVTGQTIANWESGKTKIPPAQQKKITRLK